MRRKRQEGRRAVLVIKSGGTRRFIRYFVPFAAFPALAATAVAAGGRAYVACASVCAALAVLVFISGFEQKRIGSRRLILISVFVALSVVGRFLPLFKPVTALTMLAGIYLGRESGFAAGAFSALISDFYFGFGPWTPFQMLAWGVIGYFAGAASDKLRKSVPLQVIYGVAAGIVFSVIMDTWATLDFTGGFRIDDYLGALVSSLSFTALYAISNAAFILILSKPFGEKLTRIKIKYGV